MRVYIKKQEETLINNNTQQKKTKKSFNIIKVGSGEMTHVHGETIDKNGKVMKITSERKRVGHFSQFTNKNQQYKLKSGDVYSIFDEPNMGKLFGNLSAIKTEKSKKKISKKSTKKTSDITKKTSDVTKKDSKKTKKSTKSKKSIKSEKITKKILKK